MGESGPGRDPVRGRGRPAGGGAVAVEVKRDGGWDRQQGRKQAFLVAPTKRSEEEEKGHPQNTGHDEGARPKDEGVRGRGGGRCGGVDDVLRNDAFDERAEPERHDREDENKHDPPDVIGDRHAASERDAGREEARDHHGGGQEHYRPRLVPGTPEVDGNPIICEEKAESPDEGGDPDEVQEHLGRGDRDDHRESHDGDGHEDEG